jgi:hypothetical protein
VYQFMEKGTTIEKFWPLPSDNTEESAERDAERKEKAKRLMDEITERYRIKYNK